MNNIEYSDYILPEYVRKEDVIEMIRNADVIISSFRPGQCILTEYFKNCKKTFAQGVTALEKADVEPVRHGRWEILGYTEKGSQILRCSCCHNERAGGGKSTYCRDCGALMNLGTVDLRMPHVKLGPIEFMED